MAKQLGELVLFGEVVTVRLREGISKKTGEPYKMYTAFVLGLPNTYQVLLADNLVHVVKEGEEVALSVYPELFNGQVNYRATGLWSGEVAASRALADS